MKAKWPGPFKYIAVAGFEGEVAGKFWQLLFAGCCLLECNALVSSLEMSYIFAVESLGR